jgi:hypothetical protein
MANWVSKVLSHCLHEALPHIKAWKSAISVLAILIAASLYILAFTGTGHLSAFGSQLNFVLPSFQHCDLTFEDSVQINSYGVAKLGTSGEKGTTSSTTVDQRITTLRITNPYQANDTGTPISGSQYQITIEAAPSEHFDVEAVMLDEHPLNLKNFSKNYLKSNGRYTRFRYIREELGLIVFLLNDPVSNWLLTILFFTTLFQLTRVLKLEIRHYGYTDQRMNKFLSNLLKLELPASRNVHENAYDKYAAYWDRWDRQFRFFQAIGPAIGFILTVSSLIAALYSPGGAANDLADFLNAIHVAMISTFLGLGLRIVAVEGSRINDELFIRVELLLSHNKKPHSNSAPLSEGRPEP